MRKVLLLMILLLTVSCSTAEEAEIAQPELQLVPPGMQSVGVLLDSTGSTNIDFAERVRKELIQALSLPTPPEFHSTGIAPVAGLHMQLMLVTGNPFKQGDSRYLDITLPGISGLPPRPDLTKDGALDEYNQWRELETQWEAEVLAAEDLYLEAREQVMTMDIVNVDNSGIASSLLLLLDLMPESGSRLLIASDLIENMSAEALEVAREEYSVVIIQPSPNGNLKQADQSFAAVQTLLSEVGISEIQRYRPEETEIAINGLFKEVIQ